MNDIFKMIRAAALAAAPVLCSPAAFGQIQVSGTSDLAGTLNGQPAKHVFPMPALSNLAPTSGANYNCFLVLDSLASARTKAYGTVGTFYFGGYLVKM